MQTAIFMAGKSTHPVGNHRIRRPMRFLVRLAIAMIALGGSAGSAAAQQIETPVPFDSAGRVRALTPELVVRYGLAAPVWPVAGAFVEGRMFALSAGGRVLVVSRPTGSVERYPLSDAEAGAIRATIDSALSRASTAIASSADALSQPAGRAFARNQMILSVLLYGTLLASLADDGQTGTALYFLGAGSSFFISQTISRNLRVTRAQNHLATDGAIKGYLGTAALIFVSGAEVGRKTYSSLGLAGALGGSIVGFRNGRRMDDAQAEAAATLSTLGALAGFGATGALLGAESTDGRLPVGVGLGAGLVGYALGPSYTRRSAYTVTRGDVQMLSTSAILGLGVALTAVADEDIDEQVAFATATAGWVGGAYIADRTFIRDFDYAMSDATGVQFSALAGGLMGTALAILVEPPPRAAIGLVTGGAILGAFAGHSFAKPPRAGEASGETRTSSRLRFDPRALALAAAKTPGRHAVLSLTF
jgi:hypothetical protein